MVVQEWLKGGLNALKDSLKMTLSCLKGGLSVTFKSPLSHLNGSLSSCARRMATIP